MAPVGRDVAERQQHEGTIHKARMRQKGRIRPLPHFTAMIQQVEIQDPRLVADVANTPEGIFNRMKYGEHFRCGSFRYQG